MKNISNYKVTADSAKNTLVILFDHNWNLTFEFKSANSSYDLTLIQLDYEVNKEMFRNPDDDELGLRKAKLITDLSDYKALKGYSYKCTSLVLLQMSKSVIFELSDFRAQAFMNEKQTKSKDRGFSTGKTYFMALKK